MTIVLEHYKASDGIEATIEQDKYQTTFSIDVYEPDGSGRPGFARSLYRSTYMTRDGARRAIRRRLTAPITREVYR